MSIDTTPMGSYIKAEAFRRSGMLLVEHLRGGGFDSDAMRYNYFHSIELYLKAALVCDGFNDDQLKTKFRHGFRRLVEGANRSGFGLVEWSDLATIDMIDHDGNYLRTRYHRKGVFTASSLQDINSTAAECAVLSCKKLIAHGLSVRAPAPALIWQPGFPT